MKIEDLKQGQTVWVKGFVDGCGFIVFYNLDGDEFDCFSEYNILKMKEEDVQLDQPKPVVPQFVADWYEEHKEDLEYNLYLYQIIFYDEKAKKDDFYYWMQKTNNPVRKLINMNQFGYTVEKEKLYTVEIPNPNKEGFEKLVLGKCYNNKIAICLTPNENWEKLGAYKLTEQEIRKDFDWAWQQGFAKEVEY